MFRECSSLIITFDNVQRGLALENQRGGQSSSFFKGTNQVAHKVIVFNDTSYNSQHVELTYHDQVIPSPQGMPLFETVDLENSFLLLVGKLVLDSNVPPDFKGKTALYYILFKFFSNV